jgi:putative FmdB family regulatory protein
MPLYDYECAACGRRFEVFHGVHAEGPTECPLCGKGPVRKVITAAAVHYRGSGWAKKERRSAAASRAGSSGAGDEAGGEERATDPSKDAKGDGSVESATPATSGSKPKSASSGNKSGKATDKTGKSAAATGD